MAKEKQAAAAVDASEVESVNDQPAGSSEVTASPAYTHSIRAMQEKGRWRAGIFWVPEEQPVVRDSFSDEQWAQLESDPLIAIKNVTQ